MKYNHSSLVTGHIVAVAWDDSCSREGWTPEGDVRDMTPARCRTVGRVVFARSDRLVLASSSAETTAGSEVSIDYNGAMCIPAACITDLSILDPTDSTKGEQGQIDSVHIPPEEEGIEWQKPEVGDWRIGARVTPKFSSHTFFGHTGTIKKIKSDGENGHVLVELDEYKDVHGDKLIINTRLGHWMTA